MPAPGPEDPVGPQQELPGGEAATPVVVVVVDPVPEGEHRLTVARVGGHGREPRCAGRRAACTLRPVATLRTALAEQEPGTDRHARTLANLAVALRERALQTDDLTALREAARLAREALHASQAPPAFQAARLGNLGVVLQSWHGVTGDITAADEAIDVARQALALVPAAGQPRGA